MNVKMRCAKRCDIRGVQKIAKSSWRSTYKELIPLHIQEAFLDKAYSREMLQQRFKTENFFVVSVKRKIVGFAEFSPLDRQGKTNLHALYLAEAFQAKGIGTRLIETGVKRLGAKEVTLSVEERNEKALSFYKNKGFKEVASFEIDLRGVPIQIIQMKLEIKKD